MLKEIGAYQQFYVDLTLCIVGVALDSFPH